MMRPVFLATTLLLPLVLGAQDAAAQTADRAASCKLGGGVSAAIRLQLNAALAALNGGTAGSNLKVDAIVVYSVSNPNGGQPLDGGGFTGPILCTFTDGLLPAQTKYDIDSTNANDPISGIDILASEIETRVQYQRNSNSAIELLMCLSTKSNNDCFRLYPVAG